MKNMMKNNQKILIRIVILAVIEIILISGCIEEKPKVNESVNEILNQTQITKDVVTITTDKAEYEQGEAVKAYIFNGLDENLTLFFDRVDKLEDGEWITYPLYNPCVAYIQPPGIIRVESNTIFTKQWDQKYYKSQYTREEVEEGCTPIEAQIGRYRFESEMGTNTIIYSNEFTIKESERSCKQDSDCFEKCPRCISRPPLSTACTPHFKCIGGICDCACICLS
jgi:uncharacterized protein YxeA